MKMLQLFLIALCMMKAAGAQTTFASAHAVWHTESVPDMDIPGVNFSRFAAEKDTLVAGMLCTKVTGQRIEYTPSRYITTELNPEFFYCSGDTVFYFNNYYRQFFPLYHFNVRKGDSLSLHIPYPMSLIKDTMFTIYIDSVSFVTIGGQKLRKVYTSPGTTAKYPRFHLSDYIERIGSLRAFQIVGINYLDPFGNGGGLRCYEDDSISARYGSSASKGCEYLLPLNISESKKDVKVAVFPNPFSGQLWVRSLESNTNFTIALFDCLGKKISVAISRQGQLYSISTENLSAGLYHCMITDEHGELLASLQIQKR
jgi:hypothetical protein